jgi:predicted AAA+ superfamily ATPase
MAVYITRALENEILEASEQFPALIVTGPRQVGKTTMLQKLADEKRKYISLDDPIARETAIREPALFLQRYEPPVLIDEIQYAPEILPYIKIYVDTHKRTGDFWLTGSQAFHMMKNVTESLAGRVAVIRMFGLSNSELAGAPNEPFVCDREMLIERFSKRAPQGLKDVYERIYTGAMPAAHGKLFNWERFYSSYVNTYLQRDVKDLTQIGDELAFLGFMTACAARTGQQVNYADIAKDVGVSAPTVKQWLSILVSAGIVVLIQPYFNNVLKRAIKSPNMYFTDTGLCAYLTRWDSAKTLEVSAMSGAFFETYAVNEILKSYYNAGKRPPVYYYRDTDGREIDLIIERNGTLYPIEIKKSANPGRNAVKNFSVLEKANQPVGAGCVVCLYHDVAPLDRSNCLAPVWII